MQKLVGDELIEVEKLSDEELEELSKRKGKLPEAISGQVKEYRARKAAEYRSQNKSILKQKKDGTVVKVNRLELFMQEYLKNGGNATQAALRVGNYSTMASAANAGSDFLQRARNMGRLFMEKEGYSYKKMMEIGLDKMEKSKKPDWWDRFMKIAGYADFITKEKSVAPVNVNVFQSHSKLASEYIDGEIEETQSIEPGEISSDEN